MNVDEKTLVSEIVTWFSGISDGSWGAAPPFKLIKAMGIKQADSASTLVTLQRVLKDPIWKQVLKVKNIDVNCSVVDDLVAQVRLRRIEKSVVPEKTPKVKARKRDIRLPPVGTDLGVSYLHNGVTYGIKAIEQANGDFSVQVDGKHVGTFRSISEAARKALLALTGVENISMNGYTFFGLGEKRSVSVQMNDGLMSRPGAIPETEIPIDVDFPSMKIEDPLPPKVQLCECSHEVNDKGICPACYQKGFDAELRKKYHEVGLTAPAQGEPDLRQLSDPTITEERIKKAFTDAGDFINHRARPSVLWGATLIKGGYEWFASARGIVVSGSTPEEAMLNWDEKFKTGR